MIPAGDASLAEGGCAALYVHLGLDEEFVGVGLYQFGPEALARCRGCFAREGMKSQLPARCFPRGFAHPARFCGQQGEPV